MNRWMNEKMNKDIWIKNLINIKGMKEWIARWIQMVKIHNLLTNEWINE